MRSLRNADRPQGIQWRFDERDSRECVEVRTELEPLACGHSEWDSPLAAPDGKFLLYRISDPGTGSHDLWAMSLDDRKTFPVVQTKASDREAQFSPDGKWIAYQSDETGQFEIYIQPFPEGRKYGPISTNGGGQVRWRRDGKQLELFYIGLDSRLMAVPIRVVSNGQAVEAGTPVALFSTSIVGGIGQNATVWEYSVSADGQQFLINSESEVTSPITVILNWKAKP